MKTKMHDHIVSLMRKAYDAGYGHGYRNGAFDEGNGEPFDDKAGESFDIWMDEAEGVPFGGPPRFQPIVVRLLSLIHI
jgi:hypothetical protein